MVLRKLTLALLGAGVLLPGLSHALAIRDIQTKSALGQPLRVEIELSELGDLSNDDIHVSLATPEDFSRLGIERTYFLSELRFEVDVNPGGRSVIRVSSNKRVTEPYLDFIVRISWPGNTRLQELPILLDPPSTSGSARIEPAVAAPVVQAAVIPSPAVQTVASAAPAPTYTPGVFSREAPPPMDEDAVVPAAPSQYTVRQSDTLWKIARRVRPDNSVTVHQMMHALYKSNPQAFIDNNINRLRQGEVLRVPGLQETAAVSPAAAARDVLAAQTGRPAKPLTRPPINATAEVRKLPEAPRAAKVEMKLLAPAGGKVATAGQVNKPAPGQPANGKQSYAAGAAPVVRSATTDTRHQQLLKEVSALDSKVKANDKLISVQNARLAELEAKLKARMLAEQQQSGHHKHGDRAVEKKVLATLSCAVAAQAFVSTEAKAADTAPEAKGGSMAPIVGGGVLLLLVAAIFLLRGKGKKEAPPARSAEPPKAAAPRAPESKPEPVAAPKPEPRKAADPLEEARAYLSLERFPQAVGVLNKALAQTPDRADMHLMLLEIYAKQQDRQAFDEQYQKLEALGELEAVMKADELKALLPAPAKAPAAKGEAIEFEKPVIKAEEAGPSLEDLEKDFALSLSQPNLKALDIEIKETPSIAAAAPAAEPEPLADAGLDFSFSREEPAAPVEPEPSLDFSFGTTAVEPEAPKAAAEEPLSLDSLDAFLAEHAAPAAPVEEPVPAASASGFDFEQALAEFKEEKGFEPEPEAPAAPAPAPVVETPAESGAIRLDEGLDLEEFNVSQINLPVAEVPLHTGTETGLEALEGDFSFDNLEIEQPAAAPVAEEKAIDLGSSMDLGSAAAAFDAGLAGGVADVSLGEESFEVPATGDDVLSSLNKEFPFLASADENTTRLELARAYAEMGDRVAARDLLEEVLAEGSEGQRTEAQGILMRIG